LKEHPMDACFIDIMDRVEVELSAA
jgi:hypothetical protein